MKCISTRGAGPSGTVFSPFMIQRNQFVISSGGCSSPDARLLPAVLSLPSGAATVAAAAQYGQPVPRESVCLCSCLQAVCAASICGVCLPDWLYCSAQSLLSPKAWTEKFFLSDGFCWKWKPSVLAALTDWKEPSTQCEVARTSSWSPRRILFFVICFGQNISETLQRK